MPITKILTKAARKEINSDTWPIRRRWMKIWTILFGVNMEVIVGDTVWRGGNNLEIQIFITLATAVISVLFFYVFGVVWDDHSKRQMSYGAREESDVDAADDATSDAENSSSPPVPDTREVSNPAAPAAPSTSG
jgi:hypothetical protein